jgi:membrane protein required for colicin V production
MPFSVVDLVILGLILISALLATMRGFTREALAIASWVVAAIVAYLFYDQFVPLAKQYVSPRDPVAIGVSAGGIFLVTLIIAYFITARFSDMVLDSRIGALDRTLGFIFGAARGFLIAVVGYGFFSFFAGAGATNYPWVKEAKMVPMLESAYASLRAALPDNLDTVLGELRGAAGLSAPEAAPQDQPVQPPAGEQPPAQPAQPAPAQTPANPASPAEGQSGN